MKIKKDLKEFEYLIRIVNKTTREEAAKEKDKFLYITINKLLKLLKEYNIDIQGYELKFSFFENTLLLEMFQDSIIINIGNHLHFSVFTDEMTTRIDILELSNKFIEKVKKYFEKNLDQNNITINIKDKLSFCKFISILSLTNDFSLKFGTNSFLKYEEYSGTFNFNFINEKLELDEIISYIREINYTVGSSPREFSKINFEEENFNIKVYYKHCDYVNITTKGLSFEEELSFFKLVDSFIERIKFNGEYFSFDITINDYETTIYLNSEKFKIFENKIVELDSKENKIFKHLVENYARSLGWFEEILEDFEN